ncbi:hypothetical protein PFISCL1PPCAC_7036, partial [Pristionchus fissidentatus]
LLFSSLLAVGLTAPFGYTDEPTTSTFLPTTDVATRDSDYDELLKGLDPKVAGRVLAIFRHVFDASSKLAYLTAADSVSEEQMEDMIATMQGLYSFEMRLLGNAFKKMTPPVIKEMLRSEATRTVLIASPLLSLRRGFRIRYKNGLPVTPKPTTEPVSPFRDLLGQFNFDVRQIMMEEKLPEEAINEFFEGGFLHPPYNRDTFESIANWTRKWQIVLLEFL